MSRRSPTNISSQQSFPQPNQFSRAGSSHSMSNNSHQPRQDSKKPTMNPLNNWGTVSTCGICKSVMHWAAQCPHNKSNTSNVYVADTHQSDRSQYMQQFDLDAESDEQILEAVCEEIVLFQSDYDSPSHITKLLSESFNKAVLDCGASRTVCGHAWLKIFLESLPSDLSNRVKRCSSNHIFKFGDGNNFRSEGVVLIPAVIGTRLITIEVDVVNTDIPLLFSRNSLKKAGMSIDFEKDTVSFLEQVLPLGVTSTGHYTLPITKYSLMLSHNQKAVDIVLTSSSSTKSKDQIAWKLHRQFAHAPAPRIIKLLKSANAPWNTDEV